MSEKLTIVGGGITGLVAGYIAAKSGKKVKIIEKGADFGGLLKTFPIGNTRLEYYYHHFFTHDVELKWLLSELGLEEWLQFYDTRMGVFKNGKIYDFNTPIDLLKFTPLSFWGKLKFGITSLFLGKIARWENYENVSSLDWFYRWAGENVTNALWKPLLDIKFGPFAKSVPLAWMVGRLRQRMSSRNNGDEKLGYLTGSLQKLLDELLKELGRLGVELIQNCEVKSLIIEKNTLLGFETDKGKFFGGEFLFTIPTVYLSKLLDAHNQLFQESLSKIKYFGAVCVVLELTEKLSEIYWLNIADPGFPFGGVIEHTNLISEKFYGGRHIAYLSRYFSHDEEFAELNDVQIEELMIGNLMKVYPDFNVEKIKKAHIFKTYTAATVCDLNFSQKVPDCKTPIFNLYLANMCHVYPDERSVNNSIRVAAESCKVLGIDTSSIPKNVSLAGKLGFNS